MSKSAQSGLAKLRSMDKAIRSTPDTLILDIGAGYTKLGFEGDPAPRFFFPTRIHGRGREHDKIIQIFPYKPSSNAESTRVFEKALDDMFSDIFYNHYQINPKECRVLILEPVFSPSPLRESMAKCLFLSYQVHSILFFPHSIACLHSLGLAEGLVIDIGHTGARVTPISCSTMLLPLCRDIPGLGGEYVLQWLRFNLCKQASLVKIGSLERVDKKVEDVLSEDYLEDIRCRMCAVRSVDETRTPPDAHHHIPTEPALLLSVPGELRHRIAECLFSVCPEDTNEFPRDLLPERTLPQEIAECVLKLPIDLRVPIASNLVLAGGAAMLDGFKKRLMEEINLVFSREYQGKLGSKVVFSIRMPIIHESILGWHGGSVMGACTQAFDARALKRDQFVTKGFRVPDWCQLDPDNRPRLDYSHAATKPPASYPGKSHRRISEAGQRKPASEKSIAAFFSKLTT